MDIRPRMDEKLAILKKIEEIGNGDFDGGDVTQHLLKYLRGADAEIVLSALRASSGYVADEGLFNEIHRMAHNHPDEEVRSMANGCLGAVIQDGIEFEEDFQFDEELDQATVSKEFYTMIKEFLLQKVDARMESMEVRRRALEALGHIAFLPEVQRIVLRFYHEAPNTYVKVSSIYAMGLVKNPIFERLILEELFSNNEAVLLEAIHSAANLELHTSEGRLLELARDTNNPDIRLESIMALGSVADLARLPAMLLRLEAQADSEELKDAITFARNSMKQRTMVQKGEPIWNDQLVWNEIQDILDSSDHDSEE